MEKSLADITESGGKPNVRRPFGSDRLDVIVKVRENLACGRKTGGYFRKDLSHRKTPNEKTP